MIISINPEAIRLDHESNKTKTTQQHGSNSLKKKGKGSKNIFKVALFMMRGRSRKSKVLPAVNEESKSVWRKLVGSMRPLHLQSNESLQHNAITSQPKEMITSSPSENGEDGFESSSEFGCSPSPSSSRYASAVGLNEMVSEEESDQKEKEELEVVKDNDNDGDDMIDAKAEEFIAQFYQQMRLQNLDIVDNHYREISMRSLGLPL
ncbi:uncharacterized protein LOC113873804 [Abrus precatorius]|uniref:Uncharacterized protein LOC113873804 n=1 Tax=Abrus precatorius TaxID=3816 RepID=A0A8B8MH86_ABRPR|nr:uncharacterized protein LOC113873804 [Abrus precatorius]